MMSNAGGRKASRAKTGGTKLPVLCLVGLLVVLIQALSVAGYHPDVLPDVLPDWLVRPGAGGRAAFLLAAGALIFAGVPRLAFFGLGGMLFGPGEGFAIAMMASLAGSFLSFRFLRWSGRDWMAGRHGNHPWIGKIVRIEPKVLSVALARLLPVSNILINAGLAMSRVDSRAFLLGSLLGFIPQGVAASLIGGAVSEDSSFKWMMYTAGGVMILSIMGWKAFHAKSLKRFGAPEAAP